MRADDSTCLHTSMAKTLRKVEWCLDARVLGYLPPARTGVFGARPLGAMPTMVREYLFGDEWHLGLFLFGMPAGVRVVPLPTVPERR